MQDYYTVAKIAYGKRKFRFRPDLAEDILQEAVLMLWEFDADGNTDVRLLHSKANFIIIDAVRRVVGETRSKSDSIGKYFRMSTYADVKQMVEINGSDRIEETADYNLKVEELRRASWYFNDTETAIMKALLQDKSMREVAKDMGTTEANVSIHLKKFKKKIHDIVFS